MKSIFNVFILTLIITSELASAHMMTAQHGTLNVVGDGVYMVLSLPVSAFDDVDRDMDGYLSAEEFQKGRLVMAEKVSEGVLLRYDELPRPLEGIMLSPVSDHGTTNGLASQVIVMGRYALKDVDGKLSFEVGLFGRTSETRLLKISATRPSDGSKTEFVLTPEHFASVLFE